MGEWAIWHNLGNEWRSVVRPHDTESYLKTYKSNDHMQKIRRISQKYRKAEYVQRRVCFVNVQSSLHENVVFSVSAGTCIAAYVIFIMWNSISGLDTCYHFRLNISCGGAVTVRSHQKKISGNFLRGGEGGEMFLRDVPIFEVVSNF